MGREHGWPFPLILRSSGRRKISINGNDWDIDRVKLIYSMPPQVGHKECSFHSFAPQWFLAFIALLPFFLYFLKKTLPCFGTFESRSRCLGKQPIEVHQRSLSICPCIFSPVLWGAPTQEVTPPSSALKVIPHLLHLCGSALHPLPTVICNNILPNVITLPLKYGLLCAIASFGLCWLYPSVFSTIEGDPSPGSDIL